MDRKLVPWQRSQVEKDSAVGSALMIDLRAGVGAYVGTTLVLSSITLCTTEVNTCSVEAANSFSLSQ